MSVKLLTEHHLEFLSLKGGCRGSSESTLVKMPHCWKSHAAAHFLFKIWPSCLLVSEMYNDQVKKKKETKVASLCVNNIILYLEKYMYSKTYVKGPL